VFTYASEAVGLIVAEVVVTVEAAVPEVVVTAALFSTDASVTDCVVEVACEPEGDELLLSLPAQEEKLRAHTAAAAKIISLFIYNSARLLFSSYQVRLLLSVLFFKLFFLKLLLLSSLPR
jgi:hypothetical protein